MYTNYKLNLNNLAFRASSLPTLVSAKNELTLTAKSFLDTYFAKIVYKRELPVETNAMKKGIKQEQESIKFYTYKTKKFITKNNERITKKDIFLTGEADAFYVDKISNSKIVIDIKTCYSIVTFLKKNEKVAKADYFWQLVAYSLLYSTTGQPINKGQICYTLPSLDPELVENEIKKFTYGLDEIDREYKAKQVLNFYNYEDIDILKRVKIYEFEITDKDREKAKETLRLCKDYFCELADSLDIPLVES